MAGLNHPDSLKYTKTDEWVRVEDDHVVIGITDYAQDQLGDIVYIELPKNGGQLLIQDEKFGDIESVKATSELVSPLSGELIASNPALADNPEFINDDPYNTGWMLSIKLTDQSQLDGLMSAEEYIQYLGAR